MTYSFREMQERWSDAKLMEANSILGHDESISERAEELFQEDGGEYTGSMIEEALSEISQDDLYRIFHMDSSSDAWYSLTSKVEEYWNDYYERQAIAEFETQKADALSSFLERKYGEV